MDAGSSLGIGPRIGRCGGNSPGVRYDFAEGIGKITKNTPGDRQRKVLSLATGNVGGCWIVGRFQLVNTGERRLDRPYPGNRVVVSR
ncbi:hypothetical protein B296_00055452 [Ensete ventricosum]|uniref:Uncharacterized protein n=1 Tax=Ensete ventricosum TaxID=4639 RepID=A0A426WWR5_ENSVE|nr:hypothetical protein B296_00055452 [Ensete ventricosum]